MIEPFAFFVLLVCVGILFAIVISMLQHIEAVLGRIFKVLLDIRDGE